ncbi:AVAST type 1 anti-phage system protein Avs1c [Myroides ceti]|uniref:AVAST type 1 anti-phage system protein Avs1c n=1 Tax=Paenimyroides ceti TaxID=395087 RepID=A0ABT8CSA6_9FLAO|nr:AVAST type 1 anti-phage system protein Avs1c [Paenimyroides ceti]MDN3707115.1 AVAST type 1 anti-phage system protein Avs1c [Paenimyroides ceti]
MPNSRKEFEHNMHLLKERAEKGQIHLTKSSIRSIKGMMNARYAPNQRVNLHTVDEMARLMANMVTQMSYQKEFKTKENGEE